MIGEATHQDLAAGFPIGKRFKSAPVVRVGDANPVHLGHHARADGRWRIYAFADAAAPGDAPALSRTAPSGSRRRRTRRSRASPRTARRRRLFDVKVDLPAGRTTQSTSAQVPDAVPARAPARSG